jgi:transcriptional regulator CtsR
MYWSLGLKKAELAKRFGVTPSAIYYIIKTYTPLLEERLAA